MARFGSGLRAAVAASFAALVLAGCGSSDSASYLIDGTSNYAMTLIREKEYAWSDGWQLDLVMRRNPDCQRRHTLRGAADGGFRLEVYRAPDGGFLLHQGRNWYFVDAGSCGLLKLDDAPRDPGELAGNFVGRGEPLHFAPENKPAAAAAR